MAVQLTELDSSKNWQSNSFQFTEQAIASETLTIIGSSIFFFQTRRLWTRVFTIYLYAAKYLSYMPTEEELRREIEQQKQFFLEQHNKE